MNYMTYVFVKANIAAQCCIAKMHTTSKLFTYQTIADTAVWSVFLYALSRPWKRPEVYQIPILL